LEDLGVLRLLGEGFEEDVFAGGGGVFGVWLFCAAVGAVLLEGAGDVVSDELVDDGDGDAEAFGVHEPVEVIQCEADRNDVLGYVEGFREGHFALGGDRAFLRADGGAEKEVGRSVHCQFEKQGLKINLIVAITAGRGLDLCNHPGDEGFEGAEVCDTRPVEGGPEERAGLFPLGAVLREDSTGAENGLVRAALVGEAEIFRFVSLDVWDACAEVSYVPSNCVASIAWMLRWSRVIIERTPKRFTPKVWPRSLKRSMNERGRRPATLDLMARIMP
jgi:hypothetical protein